ncbi:hypothetical protein SRABI36_03649 [Pedobacter sp. Bi36]|nr:hypothetical protein SRABI36_03649 [Pedobacter sp. Bi36]CAH0293984.1 hypothetical protein SRABI126_04143 [Pedobacter sp. Bi126]
MKFGNYAKLTPEQAIERLKKKDIAISRDQAIKILEFMDCFAKIMIRQYVK